jgi:hypothetical protein
LWQKEATNKIKRSWTGTLFLIADEQPKKKQVSRLRKNKQLTEGDEKEPRADPFSKPAQTNYPFSI